MIGETLNYIIHGVRMRDNQLDLNDYYFKMDYCAHRIATSDWEILPRINSFTELTYIVKGKAIYHVNNDTFTVTRGDLLCIPDGSFTKAEVVIDDLLECYAIDFFVTNSDGKHLPLPLPMLNHIGIHPELIHAYTKAINSWIFKEFAYEIKTQAALNEIIYIILNGIINNAFTQSVDPRVKKAEDYIKHNFSKKMTEAALAEYVGLHPFYLGTLFKQSTGETISSYIQAVRLEYARELLVSGAYSVSETAMLAGYSDVSYFSKSFKKRLGVNPAKIRGQSLFLLDK